MVSSTIDPTFIWPIHYIKMHVHHLSSNGPKMLSSCHFYIETMIQYHFIVVSMLTLSFIRFINKYPVEIKYGVQRHDNFFLQILYFGNYVVCNNTSDDVYKIVVPCFVKIENIETWKAPPSQTGQTDRPPFPKISNTHTKRGDAIPFPTGLQREIGGKQLWGA